jgi:hypothetical protein
MGIQTRALFPEPIRCAYGLFAEKHQETLRPISGLAPAIVSELNALPMGNPARQFL